MFFCPFGTVYPAGAGCLTFGMDLLIYQKEKSQQVAWVQPKKLEIDTGYWLILTSEYPLIFLSKPGNNQTNNQVNYKQQVSCRNYLHVGGRTILLICYLVDCLNIWTA